MKSISEKVVGSYFLFQGIAGLSWWISMVVSEKVRIIFCLYPDYPDSIYSFAIPDVLIFCLGSVISSFGVFQKKRWALNSLLFLTGGVAYVSLFCLNHYFSTNNAPISAILMSVSCLMTFLMVYALFRDYNQEKFN